MRGPEASDVQAIDVAFELFEHVGIRPQVCSITQTRREARGVLG
jgi:hypothetical protein